MLNVFMFGLVMTAGGMQGLAQNQDGYLEANGTLFQVHVLSGHGAHWAANDGERYTKKVFKRFWARTAYA